MIELSTHIEYLLLSHEEVSVPQLGTFTARGMISRRIDEEGIFLPPYRSVSFRWNGKERGEDFVMSLSKLYNLSQREAHIVCVEYIDDLLQTLSEEGSVSVGSMGCLVRDAVNHETIFMPTQSGIASPAHYGLDAVPFTKLSHDMRQQRAGKRAERKTRVTSIASDPDTITIRINRRLFNYVSTVAASIVLFFAFTSPYGNPVQLDRGQKAGSALTAPLVLPRSGNALVSLETKADAETECMAEAETEGNTISQGTEAVPETSSLRGSYAIVMASAISKKNAVAYAASLQQQGHKAMACEFGGMVRVIIPGFATQDDASVEMRRMKAENSDFSNVWSCLLKDEVKPVENP